MRVLRPSRKALRAGDVFVYQMPDGLYRYGRVISTTCAIGAYEGSILLYFYRATSVTKTAIPALCKQTLLIPPVATNRLGWSRGYFEVLRHRVLEEADVLSGHCFKAVHSGRTEFCDERGAPLRRGTEPCAVWGVYSYANIDAWISEVLGFPEPVDE